MVAGMSVVVYMGVSLVAWVGVLVCHAELFDSSRFDCFNLFI